MRTIIYEARLYITSTYLLHAYANALHLSIILRFWKYLFCKLLFRELKIYELELEASEIRLPFVPLVLTLYLLVLTE